MVQDWKNNFFQGYYNKNVLNYFHKDLHITHMRVIHKMIYNLDRNIQTSTITTERS